jgi:hypothetical protein
MSHYIKWLSITISGAAILLMLGVTGLEKWRQFVLLDQHDEIVERTLQQNELAGSFARNFPGGTSFITYIAGESPIWNSKAPLYGRYVIGIQMAAKVDHRNGQVDLVGGPEIYIHEIESISGRPGGGNRIRYGKNWRLNIEDTLNLLQKHKTLENFGITLTKDAPVPGFGDVLHY